MWLCLPNVSQPWERFNHLTQLPCPIQSLDLFVTAARPGTSDLTEASPLVLLSNQLECLIKAEIKLGMQTSYPKWQELATVTRSWRTSFLKPSLDLNKL